MTDANLQEENADLRRRLEEAEEAIRAIRNGAVDAFVAAEAHGSRVYTLESADRPYRLLVEQMQQGAITLNADGAIAYCNRRFADLLGWPHERLTGVAFRDFVPPDEQALYESLLQQGRAGAGRGEAHLQKADGGLIPVFLTFNALPPDSGVSVGGLVTDLTTQRHHEKLNAALEALKESDRRKNEFLAMLAHELRSPLAPIRNALHIMRLAGANGEAVASETEMMERQVGQMVRLVDDLLDVSRISRGKIELRKDRVELASAVNHAVEAARTLVQCMEHDLTVTLPPLPIYLNADPTRLAQVLGNLLSNACKFTDKGGRISLTVEREGKQAVIQVRDNGIGIAADQLPRIFDMFMQVDTSLERSVSGLGIGLTLAKNLVEMHDGTLEVHSAGAGQGSEFVVRLPIMVETPNPRPEPTVSEPTTTSARRILVVDDNRVSAESLARLLKLTGNETHTAYDGLEAVEAAATLRPDVVLLDIGLPKLNGFEAARKIREEPWGKKMMLVALTGWGQDEDRQKSREAGFNGHMVKPIDHAELMKLLASLSLERGGQLTKP
ncbi:MAG: ATP-binding protein [Deltaproteobacteria bacterium]|nr:ATP-binding protein [Deltaproteobacteria bacterium]